MVEYKKTDDGHIMAGSDGHPIVIDGEQEFSVDALNANQKITDALADAKKYRTRAQNAEKVVEALGDHKVEDLLEASRKVASMDADHKTAMENYKVETEKGWQTKLDAADQENQSLKAQVFKMTVTDKFATSEVARKLIYTPHDAAKIFESNFSVEDGQVVGKMNGNILYSKEKPGEPADFDEALTMMIEARPDKDAIMRGSQMRGSGTPPGHGGRQQHIGSGENKTGFERIRDGLATRK